MSKAGFSSEERGAGSKERAGNLSIVKRLTPSFPPSLRPPPSDLWHPFSVLPPWREPVERLATPLPLANFCPMLTLDHSPVSSSPEILGGTVVFRGTRVPVQSLIDYLQDGYSLAQFLEFFPTVDPEDARDFLRLVRNTPP